MLITVTGQWSDGALVRQVTNPNPNPKQAKLLRLISGLVGPVTCQICELSPL